MTLSTDPDFHLKLERYKRKAADGTITIDEMREAVILMRQGRVSAAESAAKSRSKSTKVTVSADDLLNQLEEL